MLEMSAVEPGASGPVFTGPAAVVTIGRLFDRDDIQLITGMVVRHNDPNDPDRVTDVSLSRIDGIYRNYELMSSDVFIQNNGAGEVIFSAYGKQYTVRAITDSDARLFINRDGASAKELEEAIMDRAKESSSL